jgi:CRP-like cAMP-binding protein
MDKQEIFSKVVGNGWFKDLSEQKVAQLIDLSTVKKHSAGEFVYMIGDVGDRIFFILEGQAKVSIVGQDGEEFVLTIWEPYNWFGEAAFHSDHTMPLEVRATKDAKILSIPITAIDAVVDNGATFYRNIMLDMIGRAKLLYRLVEALLFMPLNARVAVRMLHLIQMFGEQSDEGIVLPLKFSQSDFARMSGGSRQRVNKVFRQWAEDGVVTKKGRNYIVHDIAALEALTESTE